MKVNFYRAFNNKGESVILVHRSDFEFGSLPENIQNQFRGTETQEDEVDTSKLDSRWWLCKAGASNLETKGFDCFTLTRG